MEARFIHEGKAIDYVPGTDITAGTGNTLLGIALAEAVATDTVVRVRLN